MRPVAGDRLMLVERAELTVREGMAEAFTDALRDRAIPLLKSVPGVRWVRFGRGVENSDTFILLAEWESMAAHAAFPTMPVQAEFRAVLQPYTIAGRMEHFEIDWDAV